jgi:two-component system response regulator CpxR
MRERILLVDDNKMGLSVRKVVLEELGYQVTAVCCSLEAFGEFCKHPFDLVVTDYRMPQLDGIELIRRVRDLRPEVPVVLISGVAEALGFTESNTGADVVLQKNCHEVSNLTRAVSRLLARKVRKPMLTQSSPRRRKLQAAAR